MSAAADKLVLLKAPESEPDQGLINTLSRLLRAAKEGKIVSASLVVETPNKMHWLTSGEVVNEAEHIMGLEKLKYDLMFSTE